GSRLVGRGGGGGRGRAGAWGWGISVPVDLRSEVTALCACAGFAGVGSTGSGGAPEPVAGGSPFLSSSSLRHPANITTTAMTKLDIRISMGPPVAIGRAGRPGRLVESAVENSADISDPPAASSPRPD